MTRDLLPALPASHDLVTPELAAALEREHAQRVARVDSLDVAEEWLRRVDALAAYLRDTESYPFMQGMQRRQEARIGQLLGKARPRQRTDLTVDHAPQSSSGDRHLRQHFRTLAAAVDEGLLVYEDSGDDESPWHASRRALVLAAALRDLSGVKGSVTVEWHTPARYIEAARDVLGGIDLDPASSALANKTVGAARFYDERRDGLLCDWHGRVWLNPPYGKGTGRFVAKLVEEYETKRVDAAVLLINAYGFDSEWFRPLWRHILCFTDHRIVFTSPQRGTGGPANANLFVYLGPDWPRFGRAFEQFGTIVAEWGLS